MTGLSNGTSYAVQIRAFNANGSGSASEVAEVTPYGRPSAPNVDGTTSGESATWSWVEPDGNGRTVIGYDVQFNDEEPEFQNETTFTASDSLAQLSTHELTVSTVTDGDDVDRNTSEPVTVGVTAGGQ